MFNKLKRKVSKATHRQDSLALRVFKQEQRYHTVTTKEAQNETLRRT